jgi:hypothetical protein
MSFEVWRPEGRMKIHKDNPNYDHLVDFYHDKEPLNDQLVPLICDQCLKQFGLYMSADHHGFISVCYGCMQENDSE